MHNAIYKIWETLEKFHSAHCQVLVDSGIFIDLYFQKNTKIIFVLPVQIMYNIGSKYMQIPESIRTKIIRIYECSDLGTSVHEVCGLISFLL